MVSNSSRRGRASLVVQRAQVNIDTTVATLRIVHGVLSLELEAELSPLEEGSLIGGIDGRGLGSGGR